MVGWKNGILSFRLEQLETRPTPTRACRFHDDFSEVNHISSCTSSPYLFGMIDYKNGQVPVSPGQISMYPQRLLAEMSTLCGYILYVQGTVLIPVSLTLSFQRHLRWGINFLILQARKLETESGNLPQIELSESKSKAAMEVTPTQFYHSCYLVSVICQNNFECFYCYKSISQQDSGVWDSTITIRFNSLLRERQRGFCGRNLYLIEVLTKQLRIRIKGNKKMQWFLDLQIHLKRLMLYFSEMEAFFDLDV